MQLTESEMDTVEMETDMMETIEIKTDEVETAIVKDETVVYTLEKGEASNGTMVFSKEGPLVNGDPPRLFGGCSWRASEIVKSRLATSVLELGDTAKVSQEIKFSRKDRIEFGCMLQGALCSHDWERAEFLILLADPQTLNDALCISLDSIWFSNTQEELDMVIGIAKKIISNGAYDFTRAALRNSFLASCVFACRSQTMNLTDTVPVMAQRLRERLQECNEDAALKAAAAVKVQKFTDWAMKCIGFHSRNRGNRGGVNQNSSVQIQLQLSTFKAFLDLAGSNLTGKDFSGAFDAACFPLTLFSSLSDPDWASGVSATAIQGLLSMLVEGGADNVNHCFLEASRFGSTGLVRILLQIAQRNSLNIEVERALSLASRYGMINTMESLVEEGNASTFLCPLMRASERGCLLVVEWFVKRGSRDIELCLALTAAIASNQIEVAAFILPHIPTNVLVDLRIEILKVAGERCGGSLDGVSFLLKSNFLGDPAATYAVADSISRSDEDPIIPRLKKFLLEHWSEKAFLDGLRQGQEHYLNMTRILKCGESPISLGDLPAPLRVAIAYLPLYRECVEAGGCLLSQRLRGQLVEAARRLGGKTLDEAGQGRELLAILEHHLPHFLIYEPSVA